MLTVLTGIPLWIRAGTKKILSRRIPTVGIVRKSPSTTPQQSHKHHHHGGAVCPSYVVASMDTPNHTWVTSSKGVCEGTVEAIK
jgi:hypothetical protein